MQTDPEIERLVKEGRHLAAFKLLQERRRVASRGQPRRAPFDELLHDLGQLKRSGVPFAGILALLFGSLLVVALLILGLTFVGLRVSEWTLFPAMDRLLDVLRPVVFLPAVLPVMALAILVCGVAFARKFRSPILFLSGMIGVALGLMSFSLFPLYILLLQQRAPAEAELPLLIVGGVISLLLFVGGVQLAFQANDLR